ncbi:hypothetical protein [Paraburkholderia sp. J7]|uniref:hypothetical protein n=1 Tax=Paraburkholderia sp. J7 TaxID=2805438 RepID=UPI002AB6EF3B|nr:hypothetical protein [Paraburkholderia sp. J7]
MSKVQRECRSAIFLVCSLTSACTTNMTSVATFGDATASVATQTNAVLTKMPQGCRDNLALVTQERTLVESVLTAGGIASGKGLSPKNTGAATMNQASVQSAIQSHRAALDGMRAALQTAEESLAKSCEEMEALTPALAGLGTILSSYALGIKALAQDDFVTYKPELDKLPTSIGAIPRPGVPSETLLTKDQVASISDLQKLLYKAAIESYRQKKLKQVLDGNNEKVVVDLVDALRQVSTYYVGTLDSVKTSADALATDAKKLQQEGLLYEPIGLLEVNVRMQGFANATELKLDAVKEYVALLEKVQPAFEKARDSINTVPAQDIVAEVKDFAQSAYEVQQKMQKAF